MNRKYYAVRKIQDNDQQLPPTAFVEVYNGKLEKTLGDSSIFPFLMVQDGEIKIKDGEEYSIEPFRDRDHFDLAITNYSEDLKAARRNERRRLAGRE